jgi:hypothetical protein
VGIYGAPGNTIGGPEPGAGNVISGNYGNGLEIMGTAATSNAVQGNLIGTALDGVSPLGNGSRGVVFGEFEVGGEPQGYANDNTIGGTAAGTGNTIAFNAQDGVHVDGTTATGNTIRGNSIHSNGGKGIENVNGGNTELAPPVIDSVGSASGHTEPKCYPCTVEVFSDSEDEGRIYHGSTTTNDDATGTWAYPGPVTGPNITATITDASGNTSEFSAPEPYSPAVGGVAELPDIAAVPLQDSGSGAPNAGLLAGLSAGAVLLLAGGAWYARRRWLR